MPVTIDPVVNEGARNLPVTVIYFHDGPMNERAKPVRGTPRTAELIVAADKLTGHAVAYACRRVDFSPWDLTGRGLSAASYETFHYYPADEAELTGQGGIGLRL